MNILWVSHFSPYPPKGGAYQRSYNMIRGLAKTCSVDLVTLISRPVVMGFYSSYSEGYADITSSLRGIVDSAEFVEIGKNSRLNSKLINAAKSLFSLRTYDEILYSSLRFAKSINAKVSEKKYDAIYVDTISLMPLVAKVQVPIILNHHNIESDMLRLRVKSSLKLIAPYLYWEALKMKLLEKKYISKVSINLTCSKIDSEKLSKVSDSAVIAEIPNGVDTSYFKRIEKYDSKIVEGLIFVGGLGWYPNADAMKWFSSEIYPVIETVVSEVNVNIVGRGQVAELNKLAKKKPNVKLHGFVDDVRAYIEKSAIYICPIRDGGGTKLKILDALAMGAPLVAHSKSCEGIDVVDGKHVLMADTPSDFANKVKKLIDNPILRQHLSENGIKLIEEKYSYHKIDKLFYQSIKKAIGEKNY